MKHYTFEKCNGPVEGKDGDRLHIIYKGLPDVIHYSGATWWSRTTRLIESDWPHIEILREVEGVVMSREQCEGLFTAGENYSEGQYRKLEYGEPNEFPDKETTINNLFK